MKVEIAAGVEADLASSDELAAMGHGLGSRLDSLFEQVAPRELYKRLTGAAVPTSSTLPTYIPITDGGPPDGMEWEVRLVLVQYAPTGVFGAAQAQPVAVLASAAPVNNLQASDVVDLGNATPVSFLYPSHSFVLQAPERLYVGVLATAAQVTAAGQFVVTAKAIARSIRSQSDIQSQRP